MKSSCHVKIEKFEGHWLPERLFTLEKRQNIHTKNEPLKKNISEKQSAQKVRFCFLSNFVSSNA